MRPTPTEVMQIVTNSSISPQERIQKVVPFLVPPASWFKAHPDYLNYLPIPRETVSHLSNITQPTLVIVGADDDAAPDSLTLAEKIPESWLIRIGTAGHGLMYQHPEVFNRLLMTFLENSRDPRE